MGVECELFFFISFSFHFCMQISFEEYIILILHQVSDGTLIKMKLFASSSLVWFFFWKIWKSFQTPTIAHCFCLFFFFPKFQYPQSSNIRKTFREPHHTVHRLSTLDGKLLKFFFFINFFCFSILINWTFLSQKISRTIFRHNLLVRGKRGATD